MSNILMTSGFQIDDNLYVPFSDPIAIKEKYPNITSFDDIVQSGSYYFTSNECKELCNTSADDNKNYPWGPTFIANKDMLLDVINTPTYIKQTATVVYYVETKWACHFEVNAVRHYDKKIQKWSDWFDPDHGVLLMGLTYPNLLTESEEFPCIYLWEVTDSFISDYYKGFIFHNMPEYLFAAFSEQNKNNKILGKATEHISEGLRVGSTPFYLDNEYPDFGEIYSDNDTYVKHIYYQLKQIALLKEWAPNHENITSENGYPITANDVEYIPVASIF